MRHSWMFCIYYLITSHRIHTWANQSLNELRLREERECKFRNRKRSDNHTVSHNQLKLIIALSSQFITFPTSKCCLFIFRFLESSYHLFCLSVTSNISIGSNHRLTILYSVSSRSLSLILEISLFLLSFISTRLFYFWSTKTDSNEMNAGSRSMSD